MLKSTLVNFNLMVSKCDSSLFTYSSSGCIVYVLVYVDDTIITSNFLPFISSITTKLHTVFALKQPGALDYFLEFKSNLSLIWYFLKASTYVTF